MEIIIPHQNSNSYRERNLKYTLDYYLNSPKVTRVIVVEQETESVIPPHDKLVHMKINRDRNYFCRGANINDGIQYVKSDIIGIIDNDCIINLDIDAEKALEECDIFYLSLIHI